MQWWGGGRKVGIVEMGGRGALTGSVGKWKRGGGGVWREGCRDERPLGSEVGLECARRVPTSLCVGGAAVEVCCRHMEASDG